MASQCTAQAAAAAAASLLTGALPRCSGAAFASATTATAAAASTAVQQGYMAAGLWAGLRQGVVAGWRTGLPLGGAARGAAAGAWRGAAAGAAEAALQRRAASTVVPAGLAAAGARPALRRLGGALAAAAEVAGGGGVRGLAAAGARLGGSGSGGGAGMGFVVRTMWQDSRGYQHFEGRGYNWLRPSPRAMYGVGAAVVGIGAYYLYCMETVPYTGRRHSIMLVSSANEKWMGKAVFEEQKALAASEGRLLPDSAPDAVRVRRLGSAIAAVASDGGGGGYSEHMKGLQWEFAVIDNPTPNAFVVPGGKVVVFTGLLRLLGHSDDELAAVMAHEVGHILARHTAERMSTLNVWTLANMIMRLTLGFGLPNVAMYMGIFLPYSRLAEHEADLIGLRLMARACFDPSAAPLMLAKLNRAEKEMSKRGFAPPIPAFLRTHPLTEDRVALVQKQMQAAVETYMQSGCASRRSGWDRGAGGFHRGFAGGAGFGDEGIRFG
ncbi:hypothetical protein HYH03_010841 [Edaphochlamys debaryana]|uniref:Peptidase M48 domain-containing protein n=1 Tax=Edaphochlamys debaryana TaxID=47281 RepID=A0A835XW25_9CHLO|nr:hypothetical protein HYH03_010841 [Edaphochlamys debaryana]|eukprot:KAG2490672.1 hypothetical protein HYH03_010841 [Edaphochlamys debaryana]